MRRPDWWAVCGKWMPVAQEPCAMGRGHLKHCSTRYALDNDYRYRAGPGADPLIYRGGKWVPRRGNWA